MSDAPVTFIDQLFAWLTKQTGFVAEDKLNIEKITTNRTKKEVCEV